MLHSCSRTSPTCLPRVCCIATALRAVALDLFILFFLTCCTPQSEGLDTSIWWTTRPLETCSKTVQYGGTILLGTLSHSPMLVCPSLCRQWFTHRITAPISRLKFITSKLRHDCISLILYSLMLINTSSSFRRWTRGVNRKLSTSTANGGCHVYQHRQHQTKQSKQVQVTQ